MKLFCLVLVDDVYQTERVFIVFCFERWVRVTVRWLFWLVQIGLEKDFPHQWLCFVTSFATFDWNATGLGISYS